MNLWTIILLVGENVSAFSSNMLRLSYMCTNTQEHNVQTYNTCNVLSEQVSVIERFALFRSLFS